MTADTRGPGDTAGKFHDAARRIVAYGVGTRLTGNHDEVTVDGGSLVVAAEDPARSVTLHDGDEAGFPWRTDATAAAAISDYVEEYIDETGVVLSVRRDRFDDLVADPYDEWTLEFLAHCFPAADLTEIHRFLAEARTVTG
ncbi:MAG: hypothetical protein QM774_09565 [Gordonia sp. (in: high G+C Gram-positive bacteria)]|uniref:hypothetical protein n=1 Tax=Gordonia sp. (in: high G+C Gram-positive bacteria) TaxID=84139 RepID=UPI0039E2BA50